MPPKQLWGSTKQPLLSTTFLQQYAMDTLTALQSKRFQLVDLLQHILRQIDNLDRAIEQQEARLCQPVAAQTLEERLVAQLEAYVSGSQSQAVQSPCHFEASQQPTRGGQTSLEQEQSAKDLKSPLVIDLETVPATDVETLQADKPPLPQEEPSAVNSAHNNVLNTATRTASRAAHPQPRALTQQERSIPAPIHATLPSAHHAAYDPNDYATRRQENVAQIRTLPEDGLAIDDPAYWTIVRSGDDLIELQCPDPTCQANSRVRSVPNGEGGKRRETAFYKGLLGLRRHVASAHTGRGWFGISNEEARTTAQRVKLNERDVDAVLHKQYGRYMVDKRLPRKEKKKT